MDEQNSVQRELTEEERKNPVSSGAVEWHDPLDKPTSIEHQPVSKLAILSAALGASGLCLACIPVASVLMGIAGLVCGILSHRKQEAAKGLRTAGIFLSAAALVAVLLLLVMRTVMQAGGANVGNYYQEIESSADI